MPEAAPSLDDAVAALTAERNAFPWSRRAQFVRDAALLLSPGQTAPSSASALLRLLAGDTKWEVRKEVADALHVLPDADFALLSAQLADDENAFVKASAERAVERRRRGRKTEAKRRRGLDKVEDDLARLEKSQGAKIARLARDVAQRMYEGLVGASVHEMRSVATAMKSNVEQLVRSGGTDARLTQKLAGRMITHVGYLERLLDDMRLYTQAPSRERRTERMADLVNEAVNMVREEFAARERDASCVQFSSEVPMDLTAGVSRVQIVLALRNLVKNAFEAHATDANRFKAGEVRLIARALRDEWVEVEIADNGMGFSALELEEVRRFVPGRTSKQSSGTGFGLPIARRNIAAHGGSLNIDSVEDEGTRVTVLLPIEGREETLW
jgi:signal transduction histidine kinase